MTVRYLLAILLALSAATSRAASDGADALDCALEFTPWAAGAILAATSAESHDAKGTLLLRSAAALAVSGGSAYLLKHIVRETRPDLSDRHSFPSAHTSIAFAGAYMLHYEYGRLTPWVSVGAYAAATATAVLRVAHDRHHWYDVCAGAALGTLSAYASVRLIKSRKTQLAVSPRSLDLVVRL